MNTPVLSVIITKVTDDTLWEAFMQRAVDEYVGWSTTTVDREALRQLYQKELNLKKQYLVILLDGKAIGYSVPRPANPKDLKFAGLPETTEGYWRIGTWFIMKDYRGKGYGKRIMRAFMTAHPKIIYAHEEGNSASKAIAEAVGLKYTLTYFKSPNTPRVSFKQINQDDIIFHVYRN